MKNIELELELTKRKLEYALKQYRADTNTDLNFRNFFTEENEQDEAPYKEPSIEELNEILKVLKAFENSFSAKPT